MPCRTTVIDAVSTFSVIVDGSSGEGAALLDVVADGAVRDLGHPDHFGHGVEERQNVGPPRYRPKPGMGGPCIYATGSMYRLRASVYSTAQRW